MAKRCGVAAYAAALMVASAFVSQSEPAAAPSRASSWPYAIYVADVDEDFCGEMTRAVIQRYGAGPAAETGADYWATSPVTSPNGRFLAFLQDQKPRLLALSSRGAWPWLAGRLRGWRDDLTLEPLAVSNEGVVLAHTWADTRNSYYLIAGSRRLRTLHLPRTLSIYNAAWSPRGDIAVRYQPHHPDADPQLGILRLGRGLTRLGVGNPGSIAWSHDGRRIYFSRNDHIYSVGADGRGVRMLVRNGWGASLSPDGTRLAYIKPGSRHDRPAIMIAGPDGRHAQRLTKLTRGASAGETAWGFATARLPQEVPATGARAADC